MNLPYSILRVAGADAMPTSVARLAYDKLLRYLKTLLLLMNINDVSSH